VDWIQLAQNRDQWQALVNTATNRRFTSYTIKLYFNGPRAALNFTRVIRAPEFLYSDVWFLSSPPLCHTDSGTNLASYPKDTRGTAAGAWSWPLTCISLSIVTRLRAGRPWSSSWLYNGRIFFSLRHRVQIGSGAHQAFHTMDSGGNYGGKRPGREADNSPLPSAEVKNA